jgi:hypothetical protein
LLLPLGSFAQKIEITTGNGIIVGFSGNPFENHYFTGKVMYNINSSFQVGVNAFAGVNMSADVFANWIFHIHNSAVYAGVNAGYTEYTHGSESIWVNGKGYKAGIQAGFTTPLTTRAGFYAETGLNQVFAATTTTTKWGFIRHHQTYFR